MISSAFEALVELAATAVSQSESWSDALAKDIANIQLLLNIVQLKRDIEECDRVGGSDDMHRRLTRNDAPVMTIIYDKKGRRINSEELQAKVEELNKELPKELLALIAPVAAERRAEAAFKIIGDDENQMRINKANLEEAQAAYELAKERLARDVKRFDVVSAPAPQADDGDAGNEMPKLVPRDECVCVVAKHIKTIPGRRLSGNYMTRVRSSIHN